MQYPLTPTTGATSPYGSSGSILLLNPTDRYLKENYKLTKQQARSAPVIRGAPITYTGGSSASASTLTLASIAPATYAHPGPDTVVTCTGTGYTTDTVASLGGVAYPTTYVSATTVTVVVPAALTVNATTIAVTVRNPGEVATASKTLTIT